jgi:hypothetical protein
MIYSDLYELANDAVDRMRRMAGGADGLLTDFLERRAGKGIRRGRARPESYAVHVARR